jgi:hypothetical protein
MQGSFVSISSRLDPGRPRWPGLWHGRGGARPGQPDHGYVAVTPDYEIRVSERLRSDWRNGKRYYPYDGKKLQHLPSDPSLRPSPDALAWHLDRVFKKAG